MFASERERDPHGDKEKEEEEELYEEEGEWRGVKVEIFPAASGGLSGQTAALRSGKKKNMTSELLLPVILIFIIVILKISQHPPQLLPLTYNSCGDYVYFTRKSFIL